MKKFKDLSVGTKFTIKIVSVLGAVLIACCALIIYITANNSKEQAYNMARSLAERDAAVVDARLEEAMNTAKTTAKTMEGFRDLGSQERRAVFNSMLKNNLRANPQFFGIWTCWEPNALDNMDSQYAAGLGSDFTGRFIPYWYWDKSGVAFTPLTGYEEEGSGDYYLLARNSGKPKALEPFEYEVDNKNVLMTTIAIPIQDKNGTIVAVTGVDVALESLQNITFDKGGFESAFVNILSNDGTFVYHLDSERIGTNIKDIRSESDTLNEQIEAIKSGASYTCDDISATTGEHVVRFFSPIKIGETTTPWSIEVVVNSSEIMAATTQMAQLLACILLGILVVSIVFIALLIRSSITKPIKRTAAFAKTLASGDLDASIEIKSQDELGQLASVLDQEVRQAFKGIQEAVRIAGKQSAYQSHEVEKLLVNLQRLAQGELLCDIAVEESDEETSEQSVIFSAIAETLNSAINEIKDYIDEISYVLGEMSKGNLDVGITAEYMGDFTALKDSINGIVVSLNNVLSDINTSADQVAAGTVQVSQGSQAISQGATEQASAIEQLNASVSKIAEQTRQNAIGANQANELTKSAAAEAKLGNEQMQAMQNAMTQINDASRSISKIIKVIDDIAFQTNILALNAAVEAARAGANGKGFAVVAEEVRNLAARSAAAAKETTELIEGSLTKTEAGTMIAADTAKSLTAIVKGVDKSAQLVEEIASASDDQASAIAQVNLGIVQMSQVVQANSATSEETAAAAEELSSQAEMLKDMVGHFSLKGDEDAQKIPEKQQSPGVRPEKIDLSGDYGKY